MNKKIVVAVLSGFLIGVLWLVGLRFVLYKTDNIHYHANFALYVYGQQDRFDDISFYEEVQSCGSDEVNNPRTRVHLHDKVSHVAHVHDAASTWGHLFANLGYTLGNTVIKTDQAIFVDGDSGNKLSFILNGNEVEGVSNTTIRSEDVLLINYGAEDATTLSDRYKQITRDAIEYNKRNDPSACSGTKPTTFMQRLQHSFGL